MRGASLLSACLVVLGCRSGPPDANARGVIEEAVILGDDDGNGALPGVPLVSPQVRGYFLVTTPWGHSNEPVRVFDSTGRFIRTLGREGDGPNEYRRPSFVHKVRDSIWIYDDALRRLTVISPPESVGTERTWPNRLGTFLPLKDDTYLLTTGSWQVGRPILHIDRTGRVLQRFGDSIPPERLDFQWQLLAAAPDGGFWSAPTTRALRFQYWAAPSEPGRTVELRRSWFEPYEKYLGPTPDRPPSPQLTGFWLGGTNELWVVVQVPDSAWSSGLAPRARVEGHEYYPIRSPQQVFDTVLERVDLASGLALESHRLDMPIAQVIEPWLLASHEETADGWFKVRLWRVRGH